MENKNIGVYSVAEYQNMMRSGLAEASQKLRVNNSGIATAAGLETTITTLTDIIAGTVNTLYYRLGNQKLSDFVKIEVGKGAYAVKLLQYAVNYAGNNGKQGLINPTAEGINKDANATIQVGTLTMENNFWRWDYTVSNELVQMAARNAETFSIIEEKEKGRKTIWDLLLQDSFFVGLGDGKSFGLLNQPNVTVNTTLLPVGLEAMTDAQFGTFIAALPDAYASNNLYTINFNRLLMPSKAYMSLTQPYGQFGLSRLQVLEDALRRVAAPDFKIVHSTYNDLANAAGNGARYVLYNNEADNLTAYLPVPYTPMPLFPQGSLDLISQAHGQFVTPFAKRTTSMLYIDVQ